MFVEAIESWTGKTITVRTREHRLVGILKRWWLGREGQIVTLEMEIDGRQRWVHGNAIEYIEPDGD